MPRALSLDLRERVIAAIEEGASCREAAERFSVGVATAIRWRARLRAEGEIAAKPMGGDRHSHRTDRKSTRLNSSHSGESRMPSSA